MSEVLAPTLQTVAPVTVAVEVGVSVSTIKRIEDGGPSRTQARKRAALRRALAEAGVRVTSTGGALGISRVRPLRPH